MYLLYVSPHISHVDADTDITFSSFDPSTLQHRSDAAQVWYKHDLRTDDHPGLIAAAAAGGPVVPFYCFDARYCAQLLRTPYGIEGIAF